MGSANVTAVRKRVENDPHCGDMLEVFVRELPSTSATAIGSEEVLELDSSNEVIERWPVPPDKPIVAIRGNEIFAPHRVLLPDARTLAVLLAIRPDGTFRVTSHQEFAMPERIVCPDSETLRDAADPCAKLSTLLQRVLPARAGVRGRMPGGSALMQRAEPERPRPVNGSPPRWRRRATRWTEPAGSRTW